MSLGPTHTRDRLNVIQGLRQAGWIVSKYRSVNRAGADAIDANSVAPQFERGCASQADNPSLGR